MPKTLLVSDGKPLPFAYRWLVEQGLTEFGPWCFIEEQADSDTFRAEFVREVAAPNPSAVKDFQPFARQAACDDFAGFVIRGNHISKEVLYVHLTFAGKAEAPGFPGMTLYEDVWEWLADCVVEEMRVVADRLEEYQSRQSRG
jgi:hypothetical protein